MDFNEDGALPSAQGLTFVADPETLVETDYIHYVNSLAVVSVDEIAVAEGPHGVREAVFTVALGGIHSQTVTVDYATADGTALAGEDYVATSGTLTFDPGEISHTVTVMLTADMPIEPEETLKRG